jgi:hypothetical protein
MCWNCQSESGNAPSQPNIAGRSLAGSQTAEKKKATVQRDYSGPVMLRYGDASPVARATVAIGTLFGTPVSAQGQVLKAALDGAVESSPFLSDDQCADVMSLR